MSASKDLAIVYEDRTITIGALASKDVVAEESKIDSSRLNGFRIMKTEYWAEFENKTVAEGPIMFGFSVIHNAGEIEECLEEDPQSSVEDNDNIIAKRPVWPLEMIRTEDQATDDMKAFKGTFKPRWSCPEGQSCYWWAYNMDANPLSTGMTITVFAKHYGVWLRD